MALVGLIIAACALTACKSTKAVISNSDSITNSTKQVLRDTSIKAPADSAKLNIPVAKILEAVKEQAKSPDKPINVPLGNSKSKQAAVKATIQDGNLKVDCMCDELELMAHIVDTYNSSRQVKTQTITLPPVHIKYIPWYVSVLAWVGGIGIASAVLAYLINRFFKPKGK